MAPSTTLHDMHNMHAHHVTEAPASHTEHSMHQMHSPAGDASAAVGPDQDPHAGHAGHAGHTEAPTASPHDVMGHGGHSGMSMADMVADMRNRFLVSFILAIPISWASGQLGIGLALRRLDRGGARRDRPAGVRERVGHPGPAWAGVMSELNGRPTAAEDIAQEAFLAVLDLDGSKR